MAAVIVLLVGSGVTWAVVRADSEIGDSAAPSPSAASPSASRSSSPSAGSTSRSSSPSSSASTADDALTKARSALTACAAGIAAREQLAGAAAASVRDWRMHVDAQLKLDSGTWTVTQAHAAWDRSKARGPADVQKFAAARKAVSAADSATACRSITAATASTTLAAKGKACATRERALASVAATGSEVNSQWAAHLKMMADKPHTQDAVYHDRWMSMVAGAQVPLKRYAAAAAALARAPACSA